MSVSIPLQHVHIGTSGWAYDHWQRFYPPDVTASGRFTYYTRVFEAVEVNTTFYGLPKAATVRQWRTTAPSGFRFSIKASRYLTHLKRLRQPRDPLRRLQRAIAPLGRSMAVILFQLPPRFSCDLERLEEFLAEFRHVFGNTPIAVEFRDASWYTPTVNRLLARYKAAFCISHLAGALTPLTVTTGMVYIRLHGPAGKYAGRYDDATLRTWARRIRSWSRSGKTVFCFFDNDEKAFAAQDAQRLAALCGLTRHPGAIVQMAGEHGHGINHTTQSVLPNPPDGKG